MRRYKILTARYMDSDVALRRLSVDVEAALREGWEVSGSLAISASPNGTFTVAQPITKTFQQELGARPDDDRR